MSVKIGFHASHEQFAPSRLLALVKLAEAAGFDAAKSSDHFHPWSERQGHSGFAWSWLGAALEATRFSLGLISAPGYRYHPAVLAQAAATLGEMYPDRFWLSLGSGEAINEAITGLPWPEKAERNARLGECVEVMRALFAGETVTHRGRITVIEAKLYSRPLRPIPLFGAAVTEATAKWAASWADGLLTTGGSPEALGKVVEAFRANGGANKPIHVQTALAWAPTQAEAEAEAVHQWASASLGGEVAWDLRRPSDFDTAGRAMRVEDVAQSVHISADLGEQAGFLQSLAELDISHLHLHCVSRNQEQFVEAFGAKVLPRLRG